MIFFKQKIHRKIILAPAKRAKPSHVLVNRVFLLRGSSQGAYARVGALSNIPTIGLKGVLGNEEANKLLLKYLHMRQ